MPPSVSRISDDAYLPLKQLAAYAGLSPRTLRKYVDDRVHPMPCYRIGGKILVRRSEYDAWAARFRVAPTGAVDGLLDDVMRGL